MDLVHSALRSSPFHPGLLEFACDPDQYQIEPAPGIRRGRQSGVMHMYDRGLSEEQKMMRQSCHDFVDDMVLPYIKKNW